MFGMMVQVENRPAPVRQAAWQGLVERLSHVARQPAHIGLWRCKAQSYGKASHPGIDWQGRAVAREEQQSQGTGVTQVRQVARGQPSLP
jgi:hypothetical protein